MRNVLSNHWQTRSRTSAVAIAAISGVLAGAAACSSNRFARGGLTGLATGLGMVTVLDFAIRADREAVSEGRALAALQPGLGGQGVIEPLGGWALGAPAVLYISAWAREHEVETIVELGPGASTVALDRLLPDGINFWGVEHDPVYVQHVEAQLRRHGTRKATIVSAPLVGGWYDRDAMSALPDQIDILVVDGPPNPKGKGARNPALQELAPKLKNGALIVVDDTIRRDERIMAERWADSPKVRLLQRGAGFTALQFTG